MSLRCFIQEQAPHPGSGAKPVCYPVCEWVGDDGTVDHWHPLNRFVCSWLISDMAQVQRCDEVLHAMAQCGNATPHPYFIDGDAFNLDMQNCLVQFNASHVGPEDTLYWNQVEGQFAVEAVTTLLRAWRDFLAASPPPR
jgi:hypothetical protein